MKPFVTLILFLCCVATSARSEDYEFTKEEMAAFSPLIAGTLGAVTCNYLVDESVATAFLKSKLGRNVSFPAEAAAHLVWFTYAQSALQSSLGALPKTKKETAQYCATMNNGFGSNGTTIRGLFKP